MLVCAHCGSQHIVWDREYSPETGVTYRPRCFKCNRDKFEEVVKVELTNHEEPTMGTYGKTCAIPNCEKKSWLKGLCYKHYIEKFGEYVPVKRGTGVVVPKKEKRPTEAIIPEQAAMEQGENRKDPGPLPGIRVIIPDKLLEKLAVVAKREYRTINQQAAYFITKGLERE